MKPGFMSSVCPKQSLAELIATAHKYGYKGIEFRTEWNHQHGIELTADNSSLKAARKLLADGGIAATCIATGVKFNLGDRAEHLPHRETLRKYIALAAEVGAPYIRTFSDSVPEDDASSQPGVVSGCRVVRLRLRLGQAAWHRGPDRDPHQHARALGQADPG